MKRTLLVVALIAVMAISVLPLSAFAASKAAPQVSYAKLNWRVMAGDHTVFYAPHDSSPSFWVVSRQDAKVTVGSLTAFTLTKLYGQVESNGGIIKSVTHSATASDPHKYKSSTSYTHTFNFLVNSLKGSTRSYMTFSFTFSQPVIGSGSASVVCRTAAF